MFEGIDAQGNVCTLSDEQARELIAEVDRVVVTNGLQSISQPLVGLEQVRRGSDYRKLACHDPLALHDEC